MFGIKYIKSDSSTYIIQYAKGKIVKQGVGLSFFYHAPTTSLVSIPVGSEDVNFIFTELTKDFQEMSIQGQVTCRVKDPLALSTMLNYTLSANGQYLTDDHTKLPLRVLNQAQVSIRQHLGKYELYDAISASEVIASSVKDDLASSVTLEKMGLEINDVCIVAIKPNKETARALEAETRERLLKLSDEAVYIRRNAAIEQERVIKENELNTEIAMEEKKKEVMERRLAAEQSRHEKQQQINELEIAGKITVQKENEKLVDISTRNSIKEADANAYAVEANIKMLNQIDPQVIQFMAMSKMSPAQLLATSVQEFAGKVGDIGQLNVGTDLLQQFLGACHEKTNR